MTAEASAAPGRAIEAEIRAILGGDHADPFAVLGPHPEAKGFSIRAFLPEARTVEAIHPNGTSVGPLERIHDAGFFAGRFAKRRMPKSYRLRVDWGAGPIEFEDPYRFPPWLGELDVYLLAEGTHLEVYAKLGAHPVGIEGVAGVAFAVWAPNARRVSVVGDFNRWDGRRHPMRLRHGCGVWEIFLPGVSPGDRYKYEIKASSGELVPLKADPCGFSAEHPPQTASIVAAPDGQRRPDDAWRARRSAANAREAPIAIYEVHLGSWRRKPEAGNRYLTYGELAETLVPYAVEMGFTHLELLPIAEFPFDGSWGYQPTGLFAPTSRFGTPEDFRGFVAACHRAGLGVLLDWVPGHFPNDPHGLARFDGTHLYEHADPRQGLHRDWNTLIYNYGRREVANFLHANAFYWLDRFGIDGLRVDAVASMLYLDYSRPAGEWVPNRFGGRENLEAVAFLRRLNELVYGRGSGQITIAEESTAWPMVSRPTSAGGLGFGFKWNMGWMHDTLAYMREDPVHRKFHHDKLTFGLLYAFNENFILPLSHDEVVHGKGSLLTKMPGDRWQRFANLRLYLGFMYAHPGKKLLFMGGEFGQEREWNHDRSLDWHLLDDPSHAGMQRLVRDLNRLYRETPALHARDCEADGFEWIDANDRDASVLAFIRRGPGAADHAIAVCNFTPMVRTGYRIGVPGPGRYREALNTDAALYGGSNAGNAGGAMAEPVAWHGRPCSLSLTLPPLAVLWLLPERAA